MHEDAQVDLDLRACDSRMPWVQVLGCQDLVSSGHGQRMQQSLRAASLRFEGQLHVLHHVACFPCWAVWQQQLLVQLAACSPMCSRHLLNMHSHHWIVTVYGRTDIPHGSRPCHVRVW